MAQEGLVACADLAQTNIWLNNASHSVWVIAKPAGLRWSDDTIVPLDVELFRKTLTADGSLPVEPGITATVASRPEALRIILTENASASWATVQWLKQTANDKAVDGFAKAAAAGRPSRASFIECARAGWDAGKFFGSAPLASDRDKVEALSNALGLTAQGGTCGTSLAAAVEEARAKPVNAGALVVTGDDLLRVARSPASTLLDDASKSLGLASKLVSGLHIVLPG